MIRKLRVSTKLPLFILGGAIAVGLGIGIASYETARFSLQAIGEDRLKASAEIARDEFVTYLESIERDLHVVAASPVTVEALTAFNSAWNQIDDPTQTLQAAYIENNPNPTGEKHLLDAAPDGSAYDRLHANFHPWFRDLQQTNGYYDVFLFDTEGNLVYSVFKEVDFATNFAAPASGPWADTGLGEVYRAALSTTRDNPYVFEDYAPYGPSNGAPASFIAQAVHNENGRLLGVLAYQMPVAAINEVFAHVGGLGVTGEVALIGEDGLLRNDSVRTEDLDDILQTRIDEPFVAEAFVDGHGMGVSSFYRGEEMHAHAVSFDFLGTPYAAVAMKSTAEMLGPVYDIRNRMAMIGAALLALVAAAGFFLARTITRPINMLVVEMAELSQGNTDVALEGTERADEIGDMTRAVAVFRDAMIERERLESETAEAAEERRARQQEIDRLIANFQTDVEAVVSSVSDNANAMLQAAGMLNGIASSTNEQATSAAAASEQASANVQTVAAAAEELTASINEIGRQVEKTTQVVGGAATHAQATNSQVEKLAETANAIGNVISLISDIAEQTNLLALNATIEAARAGEAGKGFAVVASEVKSLASQTAKATEEIATQINEIQSSTREAVEAIGTISGTMGDVDQYMSAIASAVEEQGAATSEISHNVAQAAEGTQSVVGNIVNVTQATTQTSKSADEVSSAANSVSDNTNRLNETISTFLRAVAAA